MGRAAPGVQAAGCSGIEATLFPCWAPQRSWQWPAPQLCSMGAKPEPHPNSPGPSEGAHPNRYPKGCAVAAGSSDHRFESGLVSDRLPNPGQATPPLNLSFPIYIKTRENGSDRQGRCDDRMKNKHRVPSTEPGTPLALSRRLPCPEGPQGGQADVRGPGMSPQPLRPLQILQFHQSESPPPQRGKVTVLCSDPQTRVSELEF